MLPESERVLIDALFYSGYSEQAWSEITGIPRKTINNRKLAILARLRKLMDK